MRRRAVGIVLLAAVLTAVPAAAQSGEINDLQAKVDAQANRIADARVKADAASAQFFEVQSQLDVLEEQIYQLDLQVQAKQAEYDALKADLQEFAIDLVMGTQPGSSAAHELAEKYIRYGSSPRGAQALVECGRVLALMKGRVHLSTDDIRAVAPSVLRHRIILNFDAHADGQTPDTILSKIVNSVTAAVS